MGVLLVGGIYGWKMLSKPAASVSDENTAQTENLLGMQNTPEAERENASPHLNLPPQQESNTQATDIPDTQQAALPDDEPVIARVDQENATETADDAVQTAALIREQQTEPQTPDTTPEPTLLGNTSQQAVVTKMQFEFDKASWVSVKDGANKTLVYDLMRKGDTLKLKGTRPVDVFLGDGTGVKLQVNGENFNIDPFINAKKIAKFKIE